MVRAPLGESQEALAVILWRETDKAYRNAVETLSKVKSEQSVKIAEEDKSDDFSKVEPHVSLQKPLGFQVDLNKWAGRIRKFTEQFKDHPFIYDAARLFPERGQAQSILSIPKAPSSRHRPIICGWEYRRRPKPTMAWNCPST